MGEKVETNGFKIICNCVDTKNILCEYLMRYVIRYLINMTKFDDKVLTFAAGVDKGRVQTNHQRKS